MQIQKERRRDKELRMTDGKKESQRKEGIDRWGKTQREKRQSDGRRKADGERLMDKKMNKKR